MATIHSSRRQRRDLLVASACGAFVAVMVGAAYAAVPLYSWFCRTTGFGGTTQVASVVPSATLERRIKVRFDANVASGLPWRFEPEQGSIEARIGEVVTVNYRVVNEAARETVGVASYNVSPPTVGVYFSKINCFCFTDQRLAAGEKRDMAVVFFIDPALANDPEQKSLDAITLSYTMYPVRQPGPPQAESNVQAGPGRS
ncbi:MAG: cytochrome c oxidase assembly protein [Hyphomicrobiales bacterium]|nr:cytochrome c oxidase assembly protein [Hyphomicrobiales bacterium]